MPKKTNKKKNSNNNKQKKKEEKKSTIYGETIDDFNESFNFAKQIFTRFSWPSDDESALAECSRLNFMQK